MQREQMGLQFAITEFQTPSGEWCVLVSVGMGPATFNLILEPNEADVFARGLKEKAEVVRTKIITPPSKIAAN